MYYKEECGNCPEEILDGSPFSVAAAISYLAKLHLYHCYCDVLKNIFIPDEIELLVTDKAFLIYSVNCEHFFDKHKKLPLFDFTNFPKNNVLYSNKYRKARVFFQR